MFFVCFFVFFFFYLFFFCFYLFFFVSAHAVWCLIFRTWGLKWFRPVGRPTARPPVTALRIIDLMPSFFNVSTTHKSFILKGNLAKTVARISFQKNAHFHFFAFPPLKNIRFIHAFSSGYHPNLRAKNERRKIEVVMAYYQIRGVCLTTMNVAVDKNDARMQSPPHNVCIFA